MHSPICVVNFTNNMSRSGWTWHKLWNILTIYFKYKYFHNSAHWSGRYLELYIPWWLVKVLRFNICRLLENSFVKLPRLCPDLIINPLCRTTPQQICSCRIAPEKFILHLPWKAFRKRSLNTLWGDTIPCSTGKLCGSTCSLNILQGSVH